ncbi:MULTISPECIES: HNH endonuclease signature motif containing protein [unclassified Providencia]|uniref:HNH endonuclease signature motif containing protein n=1 Tax=unclassified Providencia TaxID=2633465 RepID=UPI00234AC414|nr:MULTISPECIES: HNH endonuclease signature motif containing protein [unclassified Providencia]
MITQSELKSLLMYDPITGVFKKKFKNGNIRSVGWDCGNGYFRVKVKDRIYLAHRLAWLYVYGSYPSLEIDHINRNPSDNRISNLRLASSSENKRNTARNSANTSGFKGVSFHKRRNLWQATIRCNGKQIHLGYFNNPEDAYSAYCDKANFVFGEFANFG